MLVPKVNKTLWWLNGYSFEEPRNFELVGILFGLSVYN